MLDTSILCLYTVVSAPVSANGNANRGLDRMAHRITMTDVAESAGVSLMTVSRVVNNKEDVSQETRQRVLDVIQELGYRPSSIARGLVTRRTGTLGVVVPDIDNAFFSGVVRGAENQAYADDYSVFLGNTNEDPDRELAVLDSLEEKLVDGLILCSSRLETEQLRQIVDRFPSVVLLSRELEEDCAGTVLIDDRLGGQLAAEHLIRNGHRAIGYISGPPVSHSAHWRVAGFRETLEAAGLPFNPNWIRHCQPLVEQGSQTARELLTSHPELTALICHNDLLAVGALHVCRELGLHPPEDIAIVGFDDIPLASLVNPPLTTCRVDRHELGAKAMRMLLDQITASPDSFKKLVLEPELIIRASTSSFFSGDGS